MNVYTLEIDVWIYPLIFMVAWLYASVGHGGASGYLALLAIFGSSSVLMKTSSLVLNTIVSCLAFFIFQRQKCFKWRLFLPFAIGSIPAAFWGGSIDLDVQIYRSLLGVLIFFTGIRVWLPIRTPSKESRKTNPFISILVGAAIGFVSGLIGIGGGIILSPVMLLFRWGSVKEIAAVSALFIFVNSVSGLSAAWTNLTIDKTTIIFLSIAAVPGGILGSIYGSKYSSPEGLHKILAVVLIIAGLKLVLT